MKPKPRHGGKVRCRGFAKLERQIGKLNWWARRDANRIMELLPEIERLRAACAERDADDRLHLDFVGK